MVIAAIVKTETPIRGARESESRLDAADECVGHADFARHVEVVGEGA